MKNFLPLFSFILLLVASSCESSLTDISAPVKIEFVVYDTAHTSVAQEALLDGSTNADFQNNRSKIQRLQISKIQYQVNKLGATSSDSLVNGSFEYWNPSSGTWETLSTLNNVRFPALGIARDLVLNETTLAHIKAAFNSEPYQAKIRFNAILDKKPADFTIGIIVSIVLSV